MRTLERYWSVYEVDLADVPAVVASCFTDDARFESAALPEPLVGRAAILDRVLAIRDGVRRATISHDGPVQWSHDTVRWCWSWTSPDGDATGTDVARFADDDPMSLLVVFPGHVPG